MSLEEKFDVIDDLSEEIQERVPLSSSLTPAQREELRRRIADMDANPDAAIPWEEVKAEIERRFGPCVSHAL